MTYLLQAKHLYKSFSHPEKIDILRDISLSILFEESVAIMGASGEGKTTLLHILGTLERPDKGKLSIEGEAVDFRNCHKLRNDKIGFVFQSYNLLEDFTALENILMPALIGRKSVAKKGELYQRGKELLDEVGMSHRSDYPVKLLSGGERQRIAIARAFCNDPVLLLADEPSGNLDHQTSEKIHELLLTTAERRKKALLVVTHDKSLSTLCKKKYLLHNGALTEQS